MAPYGLIHIYTSNNNNSWTFNCSL